MATATVARPAQALRQRDRAPRPNLSKRSTNMDGSDAPAKKRKLNEPYVRDAAYILRKHKGKPPSLIIHLHNLNFRFDGQEGSFAYDSPMKVVLEHVKNSTVPHEMLEELLAQNVPFYDGCLIVEVHNHKTKEGKEKGRREEGSGADGKFSMHQYNEHITPSPAVPYPSKARTDEQPEKAEGSAGEMAAPERKGKEKEKDGPRIFTTVLHPTPLTHHHEMLLLAATPASELRSKKKGAESGTPSSAQPPATPGLSVPPTPTSTTRGLLSQSQKMCLEEGDFYSFQADVLLATEPPLYLEPVSNPQDADRVLEMLSDPLHHEKAPSPKSRKRTTAEMAADDAQAAEAERRMLIMDERIKPSARTGAGAASNENQGAAASLGFSRFKTLEMVRQKHEEQERVRKDEEARAAVEKKQMDEQSAQQNLLKQQQMAQDHRKREVLLAQQAQSLSNRNLMQQKQEQLRQQQAEQQRHAQMAREHAHPQQNGMMQHPSQGNFQHAASISQGSPVLRQQTPMINSSPMLQNGGFPMAPTSSQGAGSPPRPTSAAMQNRNVTMARHASQQGHVSQNNTPQLPQGTPSMSQVVPNRQLSQTPRMRPGSPATGMQGTPTSAGMLQPTPHMGQANQFTPEQLQMLRAQAMHNQQNAANHAGSPAHVNGMQNMTPEQIQHIRAQQQQQQARQQQQAMLAAQAAQGNPQAQQMYAAQQMRQRQLQQMRLAQAQQMGQQGSPGMHPQATPQMGHAHPSQTPHLQHQPTPQMQQANALQQQMQQQNGGGGPQATPEQLAMAQAKGQQMAIQRQQQQQTQMQLQQIGQQYGGWQNIPPHVAQALPMNLQQMLMTQQQRMAQARARQQQQARAQAIATQQQQQQGGGAAGGGGGGEGQVVGGQPNPGYMQQLRTNRDLLQAQMQTQQQQNGVGMAGLAGMGMSPNFNQGGNVGNNLDQHFANMHNALNQAPQQQRGPQQQ
ncbi:hypothetical protein LTR85_000288 [Meristemomyces frigidus]|nr:hypothetical protein LTR85_000288 [Meristemomyces frigidus]